MKHQLIMQLHFLVGMAALMSFWGAALFKKGGFMHRKAGQVYVLSMACILVSVIIMIVDAVGHGRGSFALGLSFLFLLAFSATWVTWRSIKDKRNFFRYNNWFFKGLAGSLILFALLILSMAVQGGSLLYAVFAITGLVFAGSMARTALQNKPGPRWFLAQHLNGVSMIFAATHGSFFGFGLSRLLALPDSPELNTIAQTSMIVLALLLRIWIGRIYLRDKSITKKLGTVEKVQS